MNNNFTNANVFDKINSGISKVVRNVVQRGRKQNETAQSIFEEDVEKMINTTFSNFLKENDIKLTQNQFDAMLSFTFNHGHNIWGNDEKSSREAMKKFLKDGNYSQEAIKKHLLRIWEVMQRMIMLQGVTMR